MEMQELPPSAPHRQLTLESQRSENSDVDTALAAAADRHKGSDRFMTEYAQIKSRSKLRLQNIFDLFVREPLASSIC